MTYKITHPDFDRTADIDMMIAAGWKDESWANDGCPRVHADNICIWIDYCDPAKSEVASFGGEAGKCAIEFLADDGSFDGGEPRLCNSIKDALAIAYKETIGYDPFEDCPEISVEEIARTLAEYADQGIDA